MGLFDAIFGSSNNVQKWHMRDKVKDHKYFERQLERNLQSKVITEQALIESVENNNNQVDRTFLYWSLAQNAYYNIEIKYSMGGCIKELQTDYLNSLDDFRHGCDINDPIYFEILNRVALGILLKIPNEKFRLLVEYVKRVDEETNPNDWTADMLLWFMLNSHLKEMKKLYFVCIFMVLPFLMACNENHSFSLDESRQLLIVHNFLHMEIESDSQGPSESHLFFITKKNEFDTRSCDTINFRNVSSALSVEEMNSYGITKNLRRIKFRPNTRYVVIHSGMGAQVYIMEYF